MVRRIRAVTGPRAAAQYLKKVDINVENMLDYEFLEKVDIGVGNILYNEFNAYLISYKGSLRRHFNKYELPTGAIELEVSYKESDLKHVTDEVTVELELIGSPSLWQEGSDLVAKLTSYLLESNFQIVKNEIIK